MSAKARKAISNAQKARWAKQKRVTLEQAKVVESRAAERTRYWDDLWRLRRRRTFHESPVRANRDNDAIGAKADRP